MTNVVIIGAGIVGLATAAELKWRGASVTMLDPREPGSAASSGNTGWIVPSLSAPVPAPGLPRQVARWMLERDAPFRVDVARLGGQARWLRSFWGYCNAAHHRQGLLALGRLNATSYSGFTRWESAGLSFEWDAPGVTFVAHKRETIAHVADELQALANWGYAPPEWLDGESLRRRHPELSSDPEIGVHARREQIVRPESVISALREEIEEGVAIVQEPARSVSRKNGLVAAVCTDNHEFPADAVVIAAGAWSREVARQLDLELPVLAGKGYSITVDDPELELSSPLYLADAKIACTPFSGSNRFAGMMELTGNDDSIDPARVATMSNHLNRALPGWDRGARRHVWAGLRPMTPDGLPLIGKIPGSSNVYAATGHGMLGVTMAPVTGEIVSEMIVSGKCRYDIRAFEPGRF